MLFSVSNIEHNPFASAATLTGFNGYFVAVAVAEVSCICFVFVKSVTADYRDINERL